MSQEQSSASTRSSWKRFLTPGWVLTAVVVLLFSYVAFTLLAPWQLGKNSRNREFNDHLAAALEHDPVPLQDLNNPEEWTRVSLTGKYLPRDQVLLRNRPVQSSPAFQVLTPFQLDDGQNVLINRGWMAPVNGVEIPDIPSPGSGERTISGYIRSDEQPSEQKVDTLEGVLQSLSMNTEQIGDAVGLDLYKDYVQLDEDSATPGLDVIPLPQMDPGPYLSYGLQWIAFGVLAPAALIYFVYAEVRERRRARAEQAEVDSESQASVEHGEEEKGSVEQQELLDQTAPEETAQPTPEPNKQSMVDRYGGNRRDFEAQRSKKNRDRF